MRLIKRSVRLWALILAIIAASGLAIGAVMYTRTIIGQAKIKAAWGVSLWRMSSDYITPIEAITGINWGDMDPGESKGTNYLFSTCLKLKNDGNSEIWVAWALEGLLPDGVTLTASYDSTGYAFTDLPQNTFSIINVKPGKFSGYPDPNANAGRIDFILTVSLYSPPGSFSFNILLKAADSSTG